MAHLLLALHSALSTNPPDNTELLEVFLQALGSITFSSGKALRFTTQARRQVWLAQSRLLEACHSNLRLLPLVAGQIFGSAAQEALEDFILKDFKYLLIHKKDESSRPIVDLRCLNRSLKHLLFCMLCVRDVLQAVEPSMWSTSVDLKDAYFHIPIAPHHRGFLRFTFQGRIYQY